MFLLRKQIVVIQSSTVTLYKQKTSYSGSIPNTIKLNIIVM